jgi:hypothetical protein
MPDERDDLPLPEYQRRCDDVYWRHAPSCGSKGPHGARCVRDPDHLGRWCEGNGLPDAYGPKYYCWENPRG